MIVEDCESCVSFPPPPPQIGPVDADALLGRETRPREPKRMLRSLRIGVEEISPHTDIGMTWNWCMASSSIPRFVAWAL